jgi:hypothetical protein
MEGLTAKKSFAQVESFQAPLILDFFGVFEARKHNYFNSLGAIVAP